MTVALFVFSLLLGGVVAEAAGAKTALSKKKASVSVKKTVTLNLTNPPKGKVQWSTSNKKVAAIKANGAKCTVTGKAPGTANIVAKAGGKKFTCKVTVKENVKISTKSKTLKKGSSFNLSLSSVKDGKWSVGNKSIVKIKKVSKNKYKVTALKAGKTTVNVKHGGKTYKCTVTVQAESKPSNIRIDTASVALSWNKTKTVRLIGGDASVEWSVGDVNVLEFAGSNMGASVIVRGQIAGKTTLKASYKGQTYSVPVTVTEEPGIDKDKGYQALKKEVEEDELVYKEYGYVTVENLSTGMYDYTTSVRLNVLKLSDVKCIPISNGLRIVINDGLVKQRLSYDLYPTEPGPTHFLVYYKGRKVGYGPRIIFCVPGDKYYTEY